MHKRNRRTDARILQSSARKNRRLYAGIEALKLTFGGITYIAKLFNCSRNTVQLGIEEFHREEVLDQNRSSRAGGGRKTILKKQLEINEVFLLLLKDHTAGDPMDERQKWANLTRANISNLLAKKVLNPVVILLENY